MKSKQAEEIQEGQLERLHLKADGMHWIREATRENGANWKQPSSGNGLRNII